MFNMLGTQFHKRILINQFAPYLGELMFALTINGSNSFFKKYMALFLETLIILWVSLPEIIENIMILNFNIV